MKVSIVRGKFLNLFEMQNYLPLKTKIDLQLIGSKKPIHSRFPVKTILLPSPADLPDFPYKYPLLNRALVDAHYLLGLSGHLRGSDIVHTAETYYHYTHQIILAKKKGLIKKIVSTVWETIPHANESIFGRRYFKNRAKIYIDHFITPTHRARRALVEEGFDPRKISVVHMGVDTGRFRPAPKNAKTVNILTVSRLEKEKGILVLLKAFASLIRKTKKPLRLILVGRGSLQSDIPRICRNLGIQNQVTQKTYPYSEMHLAYRQADIFILASRKTKYWEEQYGMALIEAMSSGLPIIASDTGAIPEIIARPNFLFPSRNHTKLALRLRHLCQNPSLRHKIGESNRSLALKSYDSRRVSRQILKIYQNI